MAKEVFSGTPLVIFGDSPAGKELELALAWQGEAGTEERNLGIALETNPIVLRLPALITAPCLTIQIPVLFFSKQRSLLDNSTRQTPSN